MSVTEFPSNIDYSDSSNSFTYHGVFSVSASTLFSLSTSMRKSAWQRKTSLIASYYSCSNAIVQYTKRDDWISRNSHFKHGKLKQNQITIVCRSKRSEKRSAGCAILLKVMCMWMCKNCWCCKKPQRREEHIKITSSRFASNACGFSQVVEICHCRLLQSNSRRWIPRKRFQQPMDACE